jgi:hypothetical protein
VILSATDRAFAGLRSAKTRAAPSSAKRKAIASPIPAPAPVTIAILFESLI